MENDIIKVRQKSLNNNKLSFFQIKKLYYMHNIYGKRKQLLLLFFFCQEHDPAAIDPSRLYLEAFGNDRKIKNIKFKILIILCT